MKKILQSILVDLMAVAGAGAIVYGCWLWRPFLGFVAGGVLLIVGGWVIGRALAVRS